MFWRQKETRSVSTFYCDSIRVFNIYVIADSELLYAIPVSLRKPSDWSLTNKAATAYLFLPTKQSSNTLTNLAICKARLNKLKKSLEPIIGYWLYSGKNCNSKQITTETK